MPKNKIVKIFLLIFLFFAGLFLLALSYLFVGEYPPRQKPIWGINFSQKHAQNLGLDWKETYLALIDDLGAKNIKTAINWDLFEPEQDKYNFEDTDWQVKIAEERKAKLILVIGMKTSRWPECHIPGWAAKMSQNQQQERILAMIKTIVDRYQNSPAIEYWQAENETFVPFGKCPWTDAKFLEKEIALIKLLDSHHRPVLITDSGEGSFWIKAALLGDIIGTTMYRQVWISEIGAYLNYPYPPVFYGRKATIIKKLFHKKVLCVELQAEPWGKKLLYDTAVEEQEKTMNPAQFLKNVEYAKRSGLDTFYFWGNEWWYWMKTKQNQPQIWEEAKKLFENE